MRGGHRSYRGKLPFLSHHIMGICHQYALRLLILTLTTGLRWCLLGFSTRKLSFRRNFPTAPYLKEATVGSPHLRSKELCFTSLRVKYLHRLFGILHRIVGHRILYLINISLCFDYPKNNNTGFLIEHSSLNKLVYLCSLPKAT